MRLIDRYLSSIAVGLFMAAASAWGGPVQTASGLVQGISQDGLDIYKGIPYAAPPVGKLRWRDPQPVAPWSGVLKADHFSPECMQTGSYPLDAPPETSSEDCLYLNIWKPQDTGSAKLPVMVWIYGGGLDNGSGSVPLYAGDVLAHHGVIVVTFNYRLGVFGFLAHPDLSRESPHRSSGDYGLLDQIAALRWVHDNIAAFGGDPARVTVFGQSSGSISISALTTSPLTEGLFQRAIGESGGLFEPLELLPELSLPGAEQQGQRFATHAGATSLEALRALPADKLEKIPFGPALILDGYALTEDPYDVYRAGRQHKLDLLMGFNHDEGRLFLMGQPVNAANYTQRLDNDFPPFLVWLVAPSAGQDDAQALAAWTKVETDMRFRWDMWTWARLAAAPGAFLYEFDRAPPFAAGSRYAGLGATHGMEMPYVFGHLDPGAAAWTAEDRRLSDTLVSYWTNFAKTGDPNGPGLPAWPRYSASEPRLLHLGAGAAPIEDAGRLHRIDHIYAAARFTMRHTAVVIAGVVVLLGLLVAVLFLVIRSLIRRARRRTTPNVSLS